MKVVRIFVFSGVARVVSLTIPSSDVQLRMRMHRFNFALDKVRAAIILTLQGAMRPELRVPGCRHDEEQSVARVDSQRRFTWCAAAASTPVGLL